MDYEPNHSGYLHSYPPTTQYSQHFSNYNAEHPVSVLSTRQYEGVTETPARKRPAQSSPNQSTTKRRSTPVNEEQSIPLNNRFQVLSNSTQEPNTITYNRESNIHPLFVSNIEDFMDFTSSLTI